MPGPNSIPEDSLQFLKFKHRPETVRERVIKLIAKKFDVRNTHKSNNCSGIFLIKISV